MKRIIVPLKSAWHRAKEGAGLLFYTRTQRYRAVYRVTLRNRSAKTREGVLLLPLPLDTKAQRITTLPRFFPSEVTFASDPVWGNRYALFPFRLACRKSRVLEQFFDVRVTPGPLSSPTPLRPDEYADFAKAYRVRAGKAGSLRLGHPRIRALSRELQDGETDPCTLVRRFHEYVVSHLTYGNPNPGLYSSLAALHQKTTDCGGFVSLFVALCLLAGIPARIVAGFWAGYDVNEMHAWAEFLLPDGRWRSTDPSVDHLFREGRTRKSGRFAATGSDRIAFSVGCDIPVTVNGKKRTLDILQNPLIFPANDLIDTDTEFLTL